MKVKARYKAVLILAGLGALTYVALVGARIIEYSGGSVAGWKKALVRAAAEGDTVAMRVLLAFGADPNQAESVTGFTPLCHVAARGQIRATKVLLDAGADPNAPEYQFQRPLFLAAVGKHYETAELLMARGAREHFVDAVFLGDKAYVRNALAEQRHLLYGEKETLLKRAVEHAHLDAARLLLELGADPKKNVANGDSPLNLAKRQGFDEMIALLELYVSDPEPPADSE